MSAFEIISEVEFASHKKASPPAEGRSLVAAGGLPSQTATGGEGNLEYCKFCKGYYFAEYHVTGGGDNNYSNSPT